MQITVKDKKIIVELDYDPAATYSKSGSGSSFTVDTTNGFTVVPGAPLGPNGEVLKIAVNLNLIIPKSQRSQVVK